MQMNYSNRSFNKLKCCNCYKNLQNGTSVKSTKKLPPQKSDFAVFAFNSLHSFLSDISEYNIHLFELTVFPLKV